MEKVSKKRPNHEANGILLVTREMTRAVKRNFDAPFAPTPIVVNPAPHFGTVMFYAKELLNQLEESVAIRNRLSGLMESYRDLPVEQIKAMESYIDLKLKQFEDDKKSAEKVILKHPIAEKLCKIKGFTAYQLGIVIGYIKDINRFATPSRLFIYAGVAPKNGIAVNKANLSILKENKRNSYKEMFGELPDDFTEFGFSPIFKSRMFVISESLLRSKGWFYYQYLKMREYCEKRAISNNECFMPTGEQIKASKDVMKAGEYYMVGRKNFSLKNWSHKNATWRMVRILLYFIYAEWMKVEGKEPRLPYQIEYMGHSTLFTIDEVLDFEAKQKQGN